MTRRLMMGLINANMKEFQNEATVHVLFYGRHGNGVQITISIWHIHMSKLTFVDIPISAQCQAWHILLLWHSLSSGYCMRYIGLREFNTNVWQQQSAAILVCHFLIRIYVSERKYTMFSSWLSFWCLCRYCLRLNH